MEVDEILEPYERSVVREVRQWVNRQPGWMDRMLGGVSSRSRQALDLLMETEPARRALDAATDRVTAALEGTVLSNLDAELAPSVVAADPEGRAAALRRADKRTGDLRDRYVAALTAQGALAGVASLTVTLSAAALVADVAVAVPVALRAAAHHLAVYGVAAAHPSMLQAAVDIVGVATETEAATRRRSIMTVSQRLLEQQPDDDLPRQLPRVVVQQSSSRAFKEAVEHASRRVLRRRLAGLVPILGAATGGAASGWLAAQVCNAGRQVGRVTFLAQHTPLQATDVLDDQLRAGRPEPS